MVSHDIKVLRCGQVALIFEKVKVHVSQYHYLITWFVNSCKETLNTVLKLSKIFIVWLSVDGGNYEVFFPVITIAVNALRYPNNNIFKLFLNKSYFFSCGFTNFWLRFDVLANKNPYSSSSL